MISIVIPTLNEEKYLPRLLFSIENQNFNGDFEIIVADADSKDKTVEIARNFGCKIVKGGLPPEGRNEGAKAVSGDLILFLDADLALPKDFLKNLLREFTQRKLVVASTPLLPRGKVIDRVFFGIYNFWAKMTQRFLHQGGQVILVKRKVHKKIGGFDEEIKIGEDFVYLKEAAKFGKFGFLKSAFAFSSSRRFEKEGRFKTYLKYFLVGIHMLFFGPVKSDIFKYRYGHYDEID